jgi:hypothetical protein
MVSTLLWTGAVSIAVTYLLWTIGARNNDGPGLGFVVGILVAIGGIFRAVGF